MAIDDMGTRGGPRNRRQRAVRHGLNYRHMECRMNTNGTWQQKVDSRGINDLRDGERADIPEGQFARLHPEGQIPGG
jgi:hypothetical protein